MSYDVIGIGNALVDIEVQVDDAFVNKYELTKGGMTLTSLEDQRRMLTDLNSAGQKVCSGGSAANTIHGLCVLGGKAFYLGRVANDDYGQHYTDDMRQCGVGFAGPGAEDEGTGTCLILITPDTERTMLTNLGVSSALHPNNVDETLVEGSKAIYIEGYLWTGDETRKSALKLTEVAKKDGLQVAFTLSDAFIVNSYRDDLLDFLNNGVDTLFCNDIEALALAETDDVEQAFGFLMGLTDRVFMTRGKQGSWAQHKGGSREAISIFPVHAVDTTGAGDLYAAGALYGLTHDYSIRDSAILGAYCAAQVVSHLGGRMPVDSHTDPQKILQAYANLPQ